MRCWLVFVVWLSEKLLKLKIYCCVFKNSPPPSTPLLCYDLHTHGKLFSFRNRELIVFDSCLRMLNAFANTVIYEWNLFLLRFNINHFSYYLVALGGRRGKGMLVQRLCAGGKGGAFNKKSFICSYELFTFLMIIRMKHKQNFYLVTKAFTSRP